MHSGYNSENAVLICALDCYAEPNQHKPGESGHCDDTCRHTTVYHRTWRGGEPNRSGIFRKFIQGNRYWDAYRIAVGTLCFSRYPPFKKGLLENEGKIISITLVFFGFGKNQFLWDTRIWRKVILQNVLQYYLPKPNAIRACFSQNDDPSFI